MIYDDCIPFSLSATNLQKMNSYYSRLGPRSEMIASLLSRSFRFIMDPMFPSHQHTHPGRFTLWNKKRSSSAPFHQWTFNDV